MTTIRILRLRPGRAPEVAEIKNTLEGFRQAVGGHIEAMRVRHEIDLILNEDGLAEKLAPLGTFNGVAVLGVAMN
jgi:hypothetical protein